MYGCVCKYVNVCYMYVGVYAVSVRLCGIQKKYTHIYLPQYLGWISSTQLISMVSLAMEKELFLFKVK